jgi:hypothetical protein
MNGLILTALLLSATILSAQDLYVRGTRTLTPRTYIDLQGDYAYTTGSNNLSIIDISNPQNPAITGQVAPGVGTILSVDVEGDYAYCAGQGLGLVVINVHDPAHPVWVANRLLTSPVLHATAYDTLVAVATSGSVYLLDASDPASIVILDTYGRAATRAEIDGSTMQIHCASNTGGFVLEINGGSLTYRDQYGSNSLTLVTIAPPYVNYAEGAEVHAILDATYNLAGTHNALGSITALAGANAYSFVGLNTGEIQYLDQNQNSPALAASATVQAGITGLAVNQADRILVASHSTGMTVLQYDALDVPHEGAPEIPGELSISAYPNPFNSSATLQLTVATPGAYQLSVTDILGRIVHSELLTLTASRQYDIDFSSFSAGNYFIRWSNRSASAVTRVVYQP